MSTQNLSQYNNVPDANGMKIGIVVAEWNSEVTFAMMKGEMEAGVFNPKSYEIVFGEYGYKAVGRPTEEYFGAFSLEYKHFVSDRARLNILLGCEISDKRWDIYDIPDGPRTKRIFDYRITAMPGVDYIYFSKKYSRIYGSAHVGMEFLRRGLKYLDYDQRYQNNLAWQFMPFCWEVHVFESLSLGSAFGFGTLGFLRFSLSYDF